MNNEPDFNAETPKVVMLISTNERGYFSGFFYKISSYVKRLFTVKYCICGNCVKSRLNKTKPLGYVPCVHSHPDIKLAHHRATIKTKNYIADVKKGQA